MARTFPTDHGDRCDSDFERAVIDDLILRGIDYEYESPNGRVEYVEPLKRGAHCIDCGSKKVGKSRYRTLDLYLPSTDIIVEIKGKFPAPMRALMKAMIADNRDKDIRFFFMADTWLTTAKKSKLSDWARQAGIECAFGDPRRNEGTIAYGVGGIPEEWV